MVLALNNLQRLICQKTQTTKQPIHNDCPRYDAKPSDDVIKFIQLTLQTI